MNVRRKSTGGSASRATTSRFTTTETPLWSLSEEPLKWVPNRDQIKGMKFLLEHAAAGLFADPGCRKTSIVYGALKVLRKRGMSSKTLVVAPLRVARLVWPAEAKKWAEFNDLRVEVLHGPKKDEALFRDADVYVINYEGLDWLLGATRTKSASGRVSVTVDLKGFERLGFDTLVLDELSRVKHHGSGRHKAIKAISGTFARRWGLTGSPVANGLEGLFGQVLVLDQGRSFGPYITHYRSKYFLPSYDGFGYVLRKGAEEEIYERLRPLVLRLEATDLPDLVENVIRFDLPPDARRLYDQMEEIMFARLSEKDVVIAANAGVASMKCRQIANGGLYLDPDVKALLKGRKTDRGWANIHDAKTDLVEELVDELQGKPLLVAYDFKHDLDRLRLRFGADVPVLGSGVSPKREAEIEAAWNRGELPLLLGHPQSVGHGLNLQGSGNAHVCFYAGTWDEELHDQFLRRIRRGGNTAKHVFAHYLIAKDTVDETMFWALRQKGRTQKAFLDALRNMKTRRK